VEASEFVTVGRLLRTRGRRGELIAEIDSSQPGRAEKLREVVLSRSGRDLSVTVEQLWYHQGRPIFKFAGIDSISAAEPWEGAEIRVPAAGRVQPEEGEYLHTDLIGCTLEAAGRPVGVVHAVDDFGSAPLLRVTAPDGRELLIPFARAICREIDVAAKVIRADLPEGLTDL
jgi:16S rRNA processing protein RimM